MPHDIMNDLNLLFAYISPRRKASLEHLIKRFKKGFVKEYEIKQELIKIFGKVEFINIIYCLAMVNRLIMQLKRLRKKKETFIVVSDDPQIYAWDDQNVITVVAHVPGKWANWTVRTELQNYKETKALHGFVQVVIARGLKHR